MKENIPRSLDFKNFSVIPLQETHLQEAAVLFLDVYTNPPWSYDWMKPDRIQRYFQDLMLFPHAQGFVLLWEGRMIGVCGGYISDYFQAAQYEIREICIHRDLQGQGAGSWFLMEVERLLMEQGVAAVILYTRRTMDAYHFYQHNGYVEDPDVVFMSRLL